MAATLNRIAFAIADHVEEAMRLWDEYCDEVGEETLNQTAPTGLREFMTSVHLANNELNANYREQI